MNNLERFEGEFEYGKLSVTIKFNPFVNEKTPWVKGFISLIMNNKGQFHAAYNSATLEQTKDGGWYLRDAEKRYQDKNGEWKSSPYYIISTDLKNSVLGCLVKNKIINVDGPTL